MSSLLGIPWRQRVAIAGDHPAHRSGYRGVLFVGEIEGGHSRSVLAVRRCPRLEIHAGIAAEVSLGMRAAGVLLDRVAQRNFASHLAGVDRQPFARDRHGIGILGGIARANRAHEDADPKQHPRSVHRPRRLRGSRSEAGDYRGCELVHCFLPRGGDVPSTSQR
jgi:hypothetical protein